MVYIYFFYEEKIHFLEKKKKILCFFYIWRFRCFNCIIKNRENLKGCLLISDCQTSVRVSKSNVELLMRKIVSELSLSSSPCLTDLHCGMFCCFGYWRFEVIFVTLYGGSGLLSGSYKKHTKHRHTGGQPDNYRTWWTAICANKQSTDDRDENNEHL